MAQSVQVRIEMLSDGLTALMQSAPIAAAVDAAAGRVASVAGPEFEVKPAEIVGDRAMALVVPSGIEGLLEEARDKTLTKAVSACRQ